MTAALARRRVLGYAAGLAGGLAGLAACGVTDRARGPDLRFVYPDSPVEAAHLAMTETAGTFTDRTGRGVRLEPVHSEGYGTVLAEQLGGGDPPDLVVVPAGGEPTLAGLAGAGQLQELGGHLDLADLPEPALDLGRVDGALYALPTGLDSMGAILSTRILADAEEQPPAGPLSWRGFFDLCVRVGTSTHAHGTPNLLGHGYTSHHPEVLEHWLRQRGRSLFTADGLLGFGPDDLAEWFTFWLDLAAAGGCPAGRPGTRPDPPEGFGPAWGWATDAAVRLADTGRYLSEADTHGTDVRIGPMPQAEAAGAEPGYFYQSGQLLAVPAAAADPPAAVALLRSLLLDPATAAGLYQRQVWPGAPASHRVQEAVAAGTGAPPGYLDLVDHVASVVDQVGEPLPPRPGTAQLVLTELAYHSSEVGTTRISVAEGVDGFFTTASGLL